LIRGFDPGNEDGLTTRRSKVELSDGYFDIWLPALAPSAKLLARVKKRDLGDDSVRRWFFDAYERELLAKAEGRQTIQFVAQVAARTPISIGCFCADESRCHRSRLLKMIKRHAPAA
jgi:uncharacterized protein YeaO (DUF488 family)